MMLSWKKATFAALASLSLVLLGEGRAAALDVSLEQTIRNSSFIFAGTFETLGASNLSALPPSGQTALVRVREVVEQPSVFGPVQGALVTVQLASTAGAVEGGQAVFFTNGMLYGEHLAVKEVSRTLDQPGIPESAILDPLRADVAAVRQTQADEALSVRLASAVAVVSGRVGDTRTLGRSDEAGEHSATWIFANLAVDATLKGRPATGVYFAEDADQFWAESPKLTPGQQGIFLLQRPVDGDVPSDALVVVNALDVLSMDQLDRVRGLLSR
jgi:hypothetical protein